MNLMRCSMRVPYWACGVIMRCRGGELMTFPWFFLSAAAVTLSLGSVCADKCEGPSSRVANAKSSVKAQEGSIASIKGDLALTEKKIEDLGFKTTLGELEKWQDAGERERAEAIQHAIDGWTAFAEGAGLKAIE